MKIAYVSDAIYPYNKGGKEKRLYDITTRLAQADHEVHIYCMKWWDTPEKQRLENGVYLHALSPFYPLYDGERRSIKQGVLFGLHCLKLIREDWDIIDVDHMPFFPVIFTRIVCWIKKKPMYATWHEVWGRTYWVQYMGWKGTIAYIIERISAMLPDKIISVARLTTQQLERNLQRITHVTTIYSGIDLHAIEKAPPHAIHSDVIYAGRLLKHKNIDLLLQAICLLKKQGADVTTIIVGNGPEKETLTKLAEGLDITDRVTFYDFFPSHSEVLGLMKSSKVFAFPSEREGFGLAALEANACGIPFVTLDAPANATQYLIEHTNGYRVGKDPKLFADALLQAMDEKQEPRYYRKTIEKYNWDRSIETLLRYYSS